MKLLSLLEDIGEGSEYAAEEKIDGCHYMYIVDRFWSSDGKEKTANFPHITEFFNSFNNGLGLGNIILDGEIHYPGKTSQYATRVTGALPHTAIAFQEQNESIHYTIWDILRLPNGKWLINTPYEERRKILESFYQGYIAPSLMSNYLHLTPYIETNKKEFYEGILQKGGEGVVLKRKNGLYVLGKRPRWNWMKLKKSDEMDLILMDWEEPRTLYTGKEIETWDYWTEIDGVMKPVTKYFYFGWLGALVLGAYNNEGKLTEVCRCSGLTDAEREDMTKTFKTYRGRVVKITFMERTEAGIPRHPNFKCFHESKQPEECVL
jgi:ATP-dependent DNA ligase